ncbi:MAG: phosphoadenosine phosphosulfate reductase family protein [Bacteroidota bacterium]
MNLHQRIIESRKIIEKAVLDFKPKAIVLMLSGGDDSLTAYHIAKQLGINIDFIIHGNTQTGITETFDFVKTEVERYRDNLLIADAGSAYVDYVLRKGFFGVGLDAHTYAYHVLKVQHFRRIVSRHIRKKRRNFPVLFINGARRKESQNRMKTMVSPYRRDPGAKNNIWVNIINEWDKHDCIQYLEGNGIKRNPVSVNLCRSGECMCGTMQTKGERLEASFFYPNWGKWVDELEKEVLKKFPWKWGEQISKHHVLELNGQLNAFTSFQPMCVGCTKSQESI